MTSLVTNCERLHTEILDKIEKAMLGCGEFSIARAFPEVSWEWTLKLETFPPHQTAAEATVSPPKLQLIHRDSSEARGPSADQVGTRGDPLNGLELKQEILSEIATLLGQDEELCQCAPNQRVRWRWELATHTFPQDSGSFTVPASGEIEGILRQTTLESDSVETTADAASEVEGQATARDATPSAGAAATDSTPAVTHPSDLDGENVERCARRVVELLQHADGGRVRKRNLQIRTWRFEGTLFNRAIQTLLDGQVIHLEGPWGSLLRNTVPHQSKDGSTEASQ